MDTFLLNNAKLNTDSLLQNRLDDLKKVQSGTANKKDLTESEKAEFAKAARGFESIFVNMMMKEMKKGMLGKEDNNDEEDGSKSFGANTLQDYAGMMFSDHVSKIGTGIGIAEVIYEKLTGGQKLTPITVEYPAVPTPKKSSIMQEPKKTDSKVYTNNFFEKLNGRLNNYKDTIATASEKYNVPDYIIKAVISAESAGKSNAVSSAGAKGLMQLMDSTAKDLSVKNSFNPDENIMGGTRYFKMMMDKYNNDVKLALAAYNSGPGNVDKYNGVPPFKETQAYVNKVMNYMSNFKKSGSSDLGL